MNFKSWTIKTKLWFLVCGFLLNLSIMGFIAIKNIRNLVHDIEVIGHTDLPAIRDMTTIDMYHDGIRGIVYNAIVSASAQDKEQMKAVREEMDEMGKEIAALLLKMNGYELESDTKSAIEPAKKTVADYVAKANEIVGLALEGKITEATAKTPELQKQFAVLEADLEALSEKISKESSQELSLATEHANTATKLSIFVLAAGFLFGLTISLLLIRQLQNSLSAVASELNQESQEVNSMASGLGESSVSLSSATHEQASAIQETAASIDEITAMVKKTGENSLQLETSTQASSEAAERGKQSVQEMLGAIDQIKDSNARIMHQIEEGNKKIADIVRVIAEIGNKTKVINDIVFQTKLLSFNASVEAARAGEHGKGFAVVAEEVGNLAQMSGNSAKEISDMLETSIRTVETIVQENKAKVESLIVDGKEKVELGVKTAGQCGASLDEIVGQSQQVARMVEEISSAIKEQSQGVQEISKAINLLDQATTQNSNTANKTSESSSRLVTRAEKLLTIVGVVNQMIGINSAKRVSQAASPSAKANSYSAPRNEEAPLAEVKQFPVKNNKPRAAQKKAAAPAETTMAKQAVGGDSPLPNREDPRFEEV